MRFHSEFVTLSIDINQNLYAWLTRHCHSDVGAYHLMNHWQIVQIEVQWQNQAFEFKLGFHVEHGAILLTEI